MSTVVPFPPIHALTMAHLDEAQINVWANRDGWHWAYRANLAKVTSALDRHLAQARGPYPSCQSAGRAAFKHHQESHREAI